MQWKIYIKGYNLTKYEWKQDERDERRFCLSLFSPKTLKDKKLPFLQPVGNIAEHVIEIKTGPHGSKVSLIYCDYIDWEGRYDAHFREGNFKVGHGPSYHSEIFESLREFQDSLNEYARSLPFPPFGDYFPTFIHDSNLSQKVKDHFRELLELK